MSGQEGNVVDGDLAGRDINKPTYIYNSPKSRMSHLAEKFKQEYSDNLQVSAFIEDLQKYTTQVDDEDISVVGLEYKLSAAGFYSYLKMAARAKESFSKKMLKYELYESAQRIYAHILGDIWARFHHEIYPLILAGASQADILSAIQEKIIDHITLSLEENVLDLLPEEISGALYFLTGNCHITWVKQNADIPPSV